MKIKIKANCAVKGAHVEAGTSIDVDDHIAYSLIAMGKAAKHTGGSPEKKHKPKEKS